MLVALILRINSVKAAFQQGAHPLAAVHFNKGDKQHGGVSFEENEGA